MAHVLVLPAAWAKRDLADQQQQVGGERDERDHADVGEHRYQVGVHCAVPALWPCPLARRSDPARRRLLALGDHVAEQAARPEYQEDEQQEIGGEVAILDAEIPETVGLDDAEQ